MVAHGILVWSIVILFVLAIVSPFIKTPRVYLHSIVLQTLVLVAVLFSPILDFDLWLKILSGILIGLGIIFELRRIKTFKDFVLGTDYESKKNA